MKRLLTALLAIATAVALSLPAWAADGDDDHPADAARGADNTAIAVNTRDGASIFRLAFSVRRLTGDVVAPNNGAIAYSSCTACQTVAVAIQIVLVEGTPSTFTPENAAIAINDMCDLCDTLASAYQFVIGAGTDPVRFTKDGKKRLAEIRKELHQLRDEGTNLPIMEVQARLDGIVGEIRDVLATELEPVPQPDRDADEQKEDMSPTVAASAGPVPSTSTSTSTSTSSPPPVTTTTSSSTTTSTGPATSSSSTTTTSSTSAGTSSTTTSTSSAPTSTSTTAPPESTTSSTITPTSTTVP